MNTNEIYNLKDHVEYSTDSIVSKTILKKETGNITLFALSKGQEISEHSAPFDAFVQILEGEADIVLGGKSNVLKEGESIIMPANIPHALKALSDYKFMLVMIRSN
jgi:quercetin dioxygenase-like cupin family protein